MIAYKCFCGHLARSHSPLKKIHVEGVGEIELTSCRWCDKALINVEIKKAFSGKSYIRKTKAEENALPPHPVVEKKPKWMRNEEIKEFLDLMDEVKLLKTLKNFLERHKDL